MTPHQIAQAPSPMPAPSAVSMRAPAPHPKITGLCQLAKDWQGELPERGAMVEEKRDGWRALYLRDHTGTPRLFTRNGMLIQGVGHIVWHLAQLEKVAGRPMVFDGEFQVGWTLEATKAWAERGWKAGGEAGTYYAFDCLTLAEWERGGSDRPLIGRKNELSALFAGAEQDGWTWRPGSHGRDELSHPLELAQDSWAFDAGDVLDEARRVWARGGEGVMVKDAEAPYRRNRNGSWQKVKQGNPPA